jgi:hypothetical protein
VGAASSLVVQLHGAGGTRGLAGARAMAVAYRLGTKRAMLACTAHLARLTAAWLVAHHAPCLGVQPLVVEEEEPLVVEEEESLMVEEEESLVVEEEESLVVEEEESLVVEEEESLVVEEEESLVVEEAADATMQWRRPLRVTARVVAGEQLGHVHAQQLLHAQAAHAHPTLGPALAAHEAARGAAVSAHTALAVLLLNEAAAVR